MTRTVPLFAASRLRSLSVVALLTLGLITTACDSNDPVDDAGDQEVISDVAIVLTNQADATDTQTIDAVFNDGDVLQSVDTMVLTAGATYDGEITLTNRFAADASERDITEEVREEAPEHQLFYTPTGVNGITVTITDEESDYGSGSDFRSGVPVGLTFEIAVDGSASGSGTFTVVLGHYDERPKDTDETVDNTPERDIDFDVPMNVN